MLIVVACSSLSLYFADSMRAASANSTFTSVIVAYSRPTTSVVQESTTGKIVATTASSTDELGNSVLRIDPSTGAIENSVWVGSEPRKAVMAANGSTLYVGLDGARAVRKVDLNTFSAGQQFDVGSTTLDGPLLFCDIAASPFNSELVAVSRSSESSSGSRQISIFEYGVMRSSTGGSSASITFGDSDQQIWGAEFYDGRVQSIQVGPNGIVNSTDSELPSGGTVKYVDGRIYSTNGRVFNTSGAQVGVFAIREGYTSRQPYVIDPVARRAFYVSHWSGGIELRAFDIDTFVLLGTTLIQSEPREPKSIARWGSNGVAISLNGANTLFVKSDLIGVGSLGTPAPVPTPSPTPIWPTQRRFYPLTANSIGYNQADKKIYATMPSTSGPVYGNTITRIDPIERRVVSSTWIGIEPNKLVISDDGSTAYVSLAGSNMIRRFNATTLTPGLEFMTENTVSATRDMEMMPGILDSVIVSNSVGQVSIYDNGIKRPNSANIFARPIEFDKLSGNIYGYNDGGSNYPLYRLGVDSNGVNLISSVNNLMFRSNQDFEMSGGRIFSTDGRVIDAQSSKILGKLGVDYSEGESVAYDAMHRRVYVLTNNTIEVFNSDTFNKIGTILHGNPSQSTDTFTDLIRWGENGLAFGVRRVQSNGLLVTVKSHLISPSGAIGTSLIDFDGDARTDLSVFRPNGSTGAEWWLQRSSNGNVFATQFGAATDRVAAADYTGDGKTDVAVWRPSSGSWFVLRSEDQTFYAFPFGVNGDVPVPADYDADGKADTAVYRPSTSTWFIQRSSDNGTTIQAFGTPGDVPVNADYDGDGKADIAIYRPSFGQWWIQRSSAGAVAYQFGSPTDKTVVADYTGDGKADVAFWRPSTGEWYVLRSEYVGYYAFPFGTEGDLPVPGDYDGNGIHDAGVFRPSNGTWYIQRYGSPMIQQFGSTGDLPLPSAYIR